MKGRILNVTDDLSRARYEIELFLLGGAFDLAENSRFLASVNRDHVSIEISYGKLILSCWGDGWSRSWRVERCEIEPERLRLSCSRQMGRARPTVELLRKESDAEDARSRAEFAAALSEMIESSLAGVRVLRSITARDDRLHFSGVHTRMVLRDRNRVIAAVGAGRRETQSDTDSALGAGLVWLDHLQKRQTVDQLILFAPKGKSLTIATRLTAVRPRGARVSLYEIDEAKAAIDPVSAFDQGDLADRLRRARWPKEQRLDTEVSSLVEMIRRIAPDVIESHQRGGRVRLSIRGLEFAEVSAKDGSVRFGPSKKKLDQSSFDELVAMVEEMLSARRSDSLDRNGWLFRSQSERWLEAALRRDITALDPLLDPRFAYSQVPAYRNEQRTFIDLLAVTKTGRLVVIELKVAEDIEFPFQGLDYWLRVEWHLRRGDFQRRGYFQSARLSDEPPLLYLVAPLFRFHATTKLIASSIDSRAPVYRIGINEDWRAGVRVLLSERLNG
ncbi:MAG: hypothetical protein AB1631_12025 [Acidobacteriota bacterium]